MSKVAIQGNASGTGTFTIQSPATNTDRVLTLPDEAGTVLTSGGAIADALNVDSAPTNSLEVDSSSNLKFNSGYGSVATAYGCRAWVNFNGTGTVAIRDSGNVSSITDNAAGDYTINFTNAMPDDDYAMCVQQTQDTSSSNTIGRIVVSTATTNYRINTLNSAFNAGDAADVTSFVVR